MNMDARHINAFLEATKAVFDTMLSLPVEFEKPQLKSANHTHDVSGIIGLSGDVVGSVVVGFSRIPAAQIASALAGSRLEVGSADFADAIGELTNMIAGGAKAKFEGLAVSIGCPSVVIAPNHQISSPSGVVGITINCNTAAGRFAIDVVFQSCGKASTKTKLATPSAAADPSNTKLPIGNPI